MAVEQRDCTEGCDDDHKHKWEVSPNPYSSDFDVFVTDNDQEARSAILAAAELEWDDCGPGETRTLTVKHNAPASALETRTARTNAIVAAVTRCDHDVLLSEPCEQCSTVNR